MIGQISFLPKKDITLFPYGKIVSVPQITERYPVLPLSKDLFHQESPYSLSDSGEIKSEAGVFLPREVWDSIGELGKVL